MTTISATGVLRSRNTSAPDKVLSTMLLRYPRCIHAEFMTHRMFSRNAASSRAIPVKKLIADVRSNPFVPLVWGGDRRGMQGGDEITERIRSLSTDFGGSDRRDQNWTLSNEDAWLTAMDHAISMAVRFAEAGYHKQIVNRLLEPFSHITTLVSATEWDNFLELRDHGDAEPHIMMLAQEVRRVLDTFPVEDLAPGEWHLPFVSDEDWDTNYDGRGGDPVPWLVKKSTACCASTSYKTVEGFDMTMENAIRIHDKLVGSRPIHASPAEHVAQADDWSGNERWPNWHAAEEHGNFVGFRQYRRQLEKQMA